MNNRGAGPRILGAVFFIFLALGLLHAVFHIIIFGTGIPNFYDNGISGLSIGNIRFSEDFKEQNFGINLLSVSFLISEWSFVLLIFLMLIIRSRIEIRKEASFIKSEKKFNRNKNETELDRLYRIVKEMECCKISSLAKAMDVDRNTILRWAEILEDGNLAEVRYPKFGGPEIILKQNEKTK